jgi:hypothetical protein
LNRGVAALANRPTIGCGLRLALQADGVASIRKSRLVTTLATLQRLTGSKNAQPAGFKRHCRAALEELVKIGFLQSYSIDGDTVTVKRITPLPRGK